MGGLLGDSQIAQDVSTEGNEIVWYYLVCMGMHSSTRRLWSWRVSCILPLLNEGDLCKSISCSTGFRW